jgi:asparagine synthase (glutamine-hydrolysing)
MRFGLEARLPFLDYRIIEAVYRLDAVWKLRGGWTKVLLRESIEGIVPQAIQWRSDKIGFATPEDDWFREELREALEDCLADARTRMRGYVDVQGARQAWDMDRRGKGSLGSTLWRWLNLELWCRQFIDRQPCDVS